MEKRVFCGLLVLLMYLVGSGFSQEEVSEEAKWKLFLSQAQFPIVVTLTSSLCGDPCAIVEDQVDRLARTYVKPITIFKVDISEKPFFARLYNVLIVPTVIAFKGEEEIERLDEEETDDTYSRLSEFLDIAKAFHSASPPSDPAPSQSPPSGA